MRVRILKTTAADGRIVMSGEVHDLPDYDARILLRSGKAAPADGTAEPAPAAPLDTDAAEAVVAEVKRKPGRPRRAG